jgi:hypothetical protein
MRKVRPALWVAFFISVGVYIVARSKDSSGRTIVDDVTDVLTSRPSYGPRGIRNNNPGNIERTGVRWRGMSADQSGDNRFAVFDAPEWGIRAMARVLRNYMGRGVNTVRGIINTWAPPVENDTGAYVNAVARNLAVDPDQPLDDRVFPGLIAAIIQHENGQQPYDAGVIGRGIELERTA